MLVAELQIYSALYDCVPVVQCWNVQRPVRPSIFLSRFFEFPLEFGHQITTAGISACAERREVATVGDRIYQSTGYNNKPHRSCGISPCNCSFLVLLAASVLFLSATASRCLYMATATELAFCILCAHKNRAMRKTRVKSKCSCREWRTVIIVPVDCAPGLLLTTCRTFERECHSSTPVGRRRESLYSSRSPVPARWSPPATHPPPAEYVVVTKHSIAELRQERQMLLSVTFANVTANGNADTSTGDPSETSPETLKSSSCPDSPGIGSVAGIVVHPSATQAATEHMSTGLPSSCNTCRQRKYNSVRDR
jgi:hypothetical protein